MAHYLNLAQIEALAMSAGATKSEAVQLAAIAMAESGGEITAHNPDASTGDNSYGLWQINMLGQMGVERLREYGIGNNEALYDPNINAMAALKVLRSGGWNQWSTFKNGSYNTYMDAAHSALPQAQHVNVSKLSFGSNSYATASAGSAKAAAATDSANASGPSLDLKELEKSYGAIAATFKDAGLQKLVQDAVAGGWDDATFTAKLYDTKFYKQHSDAQRNWLLLWNGPDGGEAHAELNKQMNAVGKLGAQLGVGLSRTEIHDLAWKSLYLGMDATTLQQAVGAHFAMTNAHAGGQAGTLQDQYAQLADAYGLPISHATLGSWIKGGLTGNLDPESVKAHLIDQAKSMYPGLTKQLDGGQTVADVASVYRDSMSNLLELDPSQLSWRDPAIKKALQFQSDPTKPSTLMPLYQFEQQVRNDPRWLNTNNAKQSFQDVGAQVLKDFGLSA